MGCVPLPEHGRWRAGAAHQRAFWYLSTWLCVVHTFAQVEHKETEGSAPFSVVHTFAPVDDKEIEGPPALTTSTKTGDSTLQANKNNVGTNRSYGESEAQDAQERALQYTTYLSITWLPPPYMSTFYAGKNYTEMELLADQPIEAGCKILLVSGKLDPASAMAGQCLLNTYIDVPPPLDGSVALTAVPMDTMQGMAKWAPPKYPITWNQGGNFKLCFSPYGSFGLGDGELVPDAATNYKVNGAMDSCTSVGCLSARRFFCFAPHVTFAQYNPTGIECRVFIENSEGPLLYQRISWTTQYCPGTVGMGMADNSAERPWERRWAKKVDPLALISMGLPVTYLTTGFRYKLCYCAGYSDSGQQFCLSTADFVQEVGWLHMFVVSYLGLDNQPKQQLLPMQRFTIKVDCGGPHCNKTAHSMMKVVAKDSTNDFTHWNVSGGCRKAYETGFWASPPNCQNLTGGEKTYRDCHLHGGNKSEYKLFGEGITRFYQQWENNFPISQHYDVCFVNDPLPVVGILNETNWIPNIGNNLANHPRLWWKVGELVILPLRILNPHSFVIQTPFSLRISAPDTGKSSLLHGHATTGPMMKLLHDPDQRMKDRDCSRKLIEQSKVLGVWCYERSLCTPRGVSDTGSNDNGLIFNSGDADHRLTVSKSGVYAVCYCEGPDGSPSACGEPTHWILVDWLVVAGPSCCEDWQLVTSVVTSFQLNGLKLNQWNTIRILPTYKKCDDDVLDVVETSIGICLPAEPTCRMHNVTNNPNDGTVPDIPVSLRGYNTTLPLSYITGLMRDPYDSYTVINFSQVPVLMEQDVIHIEDNVIPAADTWMRQRDLARQIAGGDVGHRALAFYDNGRAVKIPLKFQDFPPITIFPEGQGKWHRSNRADVPFIKGTAQKTRLNVCWSSGNGEYKSLAGYLTFVDPNYLPKIALGMTTRAVGVAAPLVISFTTGRRTQYTEATNSLQLKITFKNHSKLGAWQSGTHPVKLEPLTDGDQPHKASQTVCGRLFSEMWSSDPLGFPVPAGCYYPAQYPGTFEQPMMIIFEPQNGLNSETEYQLVLNAVSHEVMGPTETYDEKNPAVEVTALDDIITNPFGVIELGRSNPDKTIVAGPARNGPKFFKGTLGVIALQTLNELSDITSESNAKVLELPHDQATLDFAIRGDPSGRIVQGSIIRLFLWPLTIWRLDPISNCNAELIEQKGHIQAGQIKCYQEAVVSKCVDFLPPRKKAWTDSRGRDCVYYGEQNKCEVDGADYEMFGQTARTACCTCGGGDRYPANAMRLVLPTKMEPIYGNELVHTIRLVSISPMPPEGFFTTRWSAQLTDPLDEGPSYTTTTGAYLMKTPNNAKVSSMATIVDQAGWGNSKPFKGDILNDVYVRLQFPVKVESTPATTELAYFTLSLPEGYTCREVQPAYPQGTGAMAILLPVLPSASPSGNGMLAPSTMKSKDGFWGFKQNECTFKVMTFGTLFYNQRVYLHVYFDNPVVPLGFMNSKNKWHLSFHSRGSPYTPEFLPGILQDYISPFLPRTTQPKPFGPPQCFPYQPPTCNHTGEGFYANPQGDPILLNEQYPVTPNQTIGPYLLTVPPEDEKLEPKALEWFTDRLTVLGKLTEVVVQPHHLHLGAETRLEIWFIAEQYSGKGPILTIDAPEGFHFRCGVQDLNPSYYAIHGRNPTDGENALKIVYPLDEVSRCYPDKKTEESEAFNRAVITTIGPLLANQHYGFSIAVRNPLDYNSNFHSGSAWTFKVSVALSSGHALDGTYGTGRFNQMSLPNASEPWHLYTSTCKPIRVNIPSMKPYGWTGETSEITVGPIEMLKTVKGRLRVTAPAGYEWIWGRKKYDFAYVPFDAEDMDEKLKVKFATHEFPGGVPPLPKVGPWNVFTWPNAELFLFGRIYAFRTHIMIPFRQPQASTNAFYFEWGYDEYSVGSPYLPQLISGRAAAARVKADTVKALQNGESLLSNMIVGEFARLWLGIQTVSPISVNGSLEIILPYLEMSFKSYEVGGDGRYCIVRRGVGGAPLPHPFYCRHILFPGLTPNEARIVLFANETGLPAAKYVFDFDVKNPPKTVANKALTTGNQSSGSSSTRRLSEDEDNVVVSGSTSDIGSASARQLAANTKSPYTCGYSLCFTFVSNTVRYPMVLRAFDSLYQSGGRWIALNPAPIEKAKTQSDFFMSLPASPITIPMQHAEILEVAREKRKLVGRNDGPLQPNKLIFAFELDKMTPEPNDVLRVRAPKGFIFDTVCKITTDFDKLYPPLTQEDKPPVNISMRPLNKWPKDAYLAACRGGSNIARLQFGPGLQPRRLYTFMIDLKRNPKFAPDWNKWLLDFGEESSREVKGFDLWTFQDAKVDPRSSSRNIKMAPISTPVTISIRPFNPVWSASDVFNEAKTAGVLKITAPTGFKVEYRKWPEMECKALIVEVGDCLVCGVPILDNNYRCKVAMNQHNIAMLIFDQAYTLNSGTLYQITLSVFNPPIVSLGSRDWQIESFLAEDMRYGLDYSRIEGYRISERADIFVERPAERNGSLLVDPMEFMFHFNDPIMPGDSIELVGPNEFYFQDMQELDKCLDFKYIPSMLPGSVAFNGQLFSPGPVRYDLPGWDLLPPHVNDTAQNWVVSQIMCFNQTMKNISENMSLPGSRSVNYSFLGVHVKENATHPEASTVCARVRRVSLVPAPTSTTTTSTTLAERLLQESASTTTSSTTTEDRSLQESNDTDTDGMSDGDNATEEVSSTTTTTTTTTSTEIRTTTTVYVPPEFVDFVEEFDVCMNDTDSEIPPMLLSNYFDLPPNATMTSMRQIIAPECHTEWRHFNHTLAVNLTWNSSSNMSGVVEKMMRKQAVKWENRTLSHFPLLDQPACRENKIVWFIRASGIHEDYRGQNVTLEVRFRAQYRNPPRTPLRHLNFWQLVHKDNTGVYKSSALERGWAIVSQLSNLKFELVEDKVIVGMLAKIHLEFVTINRADTLRIEVKEPPGFDFSVAYVCLAPAGDCTEMQIPPTEPPDDRRLATKRADYTPKVYIKEKNKNVITFSVEFDTQQYVQIKLADVRLPPVGGQTVIDFSTVRLNEVQDWLLNCCAGGPTGQTFRIPMPLMMGARFMENKYRKDPQKYPVEATLETRYGDTAFMYFSFQLAYPYYRAPGPNRPITLVIRAPEGYQFHDDLYELRDMSLCRKNPNPQIAGCWFPEVFKQLIYMKENLMAMAFPFENRLNVSRDYRILVKVTTPEEPPDEDAPAHDKSWHVQITDKEDFEADKLPVHSGAGEDFPLASPLRFSLTAPRSPPETVIEVTVIFLKVGKRPASVVNIFAPPGYQFLQDCLAPGKSVAVFTGCRERWSRFQGIKLSGAFLQTIDGGLYDAICPVTLTILARTPSFTPEINKWYAQGLLRDQSVAWDSLVAPFPVSQMSAGHFYPALSAAIGEVVLEFTVREPLDFGCFIHVQAPRTYRLGCPVKKLFAGPQQGVPYCTQDHPLLNNCEGLPTPAEYAAGKNTSELFPEDQVHPCDPAHEVMLYYPEEMRPTTRPPDLIGADVTEIEKLAMPIGKVIMVMPIELPMKTPTPRLENRFQIRLMDWQQRITDGKLNLWGEQIQEFPQAHNFNLWWTAAAPDSQVDVAIGFTLLEPIPEEIGFTTVQIIVPPNFRQAIRKPSDVRKLEEDFPIKLWSWSVRMPRHVWFTLREGEIPAKTFHVSFPVFAPSYVQGTPEYNIWRVNLCKDPTFCREEILSVPLPGFLFGEIPTVQLSESARKRMVGTASRREGHVGAWIFLIPLVLGLPWQHGDH